MENWYESKMKENCVEMFESLWMTLYILISSLSGWISLDRFNYILTPDHTVVCFYVKIQIIIYKNLINILYLLYIILIILIKFIDSKY